MISLLKRKKIRKSHDWKIMMKKVFTDKFGNDWFEYSNPLTLPAKRAIAAEVATRFAEMNLTKANLIRIMAEMKKKANEGNIVEVFNLLSELEFRLNFLGEEETLIELALCYFVIEGEDETGFDDISRAKKLEILKSDEEAKGFFLESAFRYTIQYSDSSGAGILAYLRANEPNEKRLRRILQELKLEDTLMK